MKYDVFFFVAGSLSAWAAFKLNCPLLAQFPIDAIQKNKTYSQSGLQLDGKHNKYLCYGAALLAGILFGLTHKSPIVSPIQIAVFVIYFWAISGLQKNYLMIVFAGLVCGVGYAFVRFYTVGIPTSVMLAMGATNVVFFILVGLGLRWFYSPNRLFSCFALASWIVLIEWMLFTAVPLFGTAQSFVVSWSVLPWSIQYISITGILGIVFLVSLLGILAHSALVQAETKRQYLIVMAIVLSIVGITNSVYWAQSSTSTVRVAVSGHSGDDFPVDTDLVLSEHVVPGISEASQEGAAIIVFPEMTFVFASNEERVNAIDQLKTLAIENQIGVIVGFSDEVRDGNYAIQIDAGGVLLGEYQKTHLVPLMEDCNPGDGKLVIGEFDGIRTGVLICQDDNFTDLSRGLSREQVVIVGVPTLDWRSVAKEHFLNSRFRAIESRYAIMRAADGGISAIISAKGQVLKSVNHLEKGTSVIVANVPLRNGGSWFAIWSHGLMLLVSVVLLLSNIIFSLSLQRRGTLPD